MRRFSALLLVALVALVARTARTASADDPKLTPRPDAFPTLVNPSCSHCVDEAKRRAKELKDDDPVLMWTRGYSDGGAIPIRFFLSKHRVISDSYGVFVYDPDAGFARGFAPSYNFAFHGWRNGVMVIKDTKDGTLYSALSGLAFDGPKKGQRLKSVPTLTTTWGELMATYPDAVAYQMFDKYQPVPLPKEPNAESVKTRPAKTDPRLKPEALVLGVRVGDKTVAYPLAALEKPGAIGTLAVPRRIGDEEIVLLFHQPTRSCGAYKPVAHQPRKFKMPKPDKDGVSQPDDGVPLPLGSEAKKPHRVELENATPGPPTDPKGRPSTVVSKDPATKWDVTGRGVSGALKGWTLEPVDCVVCKWFAWAAEYPDTEVGSDAKPEPKPAAKSDPEDALSSAAGSAELLRLLPKPFATLKAFDAKARTVTLLLDGEKVAKVWPLEPDAEVKVAGFWGRPEQFKPDQRVWVWLKLNRQKHPTAVVMLADERSEEYIHNKVALEPGAPDPKRADQVQWMRRRWTEEGLPGTIGVAHLFSGEVEVLIDHEGMRWARALRRGDITHITADPPIKAVVKAVSPWRERTQLRLVVGELAASELKPGGRALVKVPDPGPVDLAEYPPDLGRERSKDQRVEWFLASTYCTCSVKKDTCTGHFYTLASCNPYGCGAPNATRKKIGALIDKGLTDKEIWDALLKENGPLMTRPHLLP
jgi:hypothetical protein